MAESETNGLTMKLMALSNHIEGPKAAEVKEIITQLPTAAYNERTQSKITIAQLEKEIDSLKQRLAKEVLVNGAQHPTPPSGPRSHRQDSFSSSPSTKDKSNRLYVGNLSYDVKESDIRDFFADCRIESIFLPTNPRTNLPQGFAFVSTASAAEAEKAVKDRHHAQMNNRIITVEMAKVDLTRGPGRDQATPGEYYVPRDPRRPSPAVPRGSLADGDPARPAKRQRTQSPQPKRTPVCTGCFQTGSVCDGTAECSTCHRRGYGCEYRVCRNHLNCSEKNCSRLHVDQWNPNLEPQRKVKVWVP